MLFDLSGSLGGASLQGSLYRQAAEAAGVSSWEGGREVHRSQPIPKSSFLQQLEVEGEGEEEQEPRDEEVRRRSSASCSALLSVDASGAGAD